jgi:hypothetical protein
MIETKNIKYLDSFLCYLFKWVVFAVLQNFLIKEESNMEILEIPGQFSKERMEEIHS